MGKLERELAHITQKNNDGLLDLSSFQAQQLSELRLKLSSAKRHFTQLQTQKQSFEAERDPSHQGFEKDFESLKTFFPDADIKRLSEIEQFHKQLSSVLKKEFKESAANLQAMMDLVQKQIADLEDKIKTLNDMPTVSQAVLERYAEVQRELHLLKDSNQNFDFLMDLQKNVSELKRTYDALIRTVFSSIQAEINQKAHQLNDFLFDGLKTPPVLSIKSANEYYFYTPNDRGTGTEYKGLIVFDLALLEMTVLPILVHDSVLLKQIQDDALEKILDLYSQSSKQIFIALDKEGSYTQKAQEILKTSEVIRLYPDGGELFGRAWNINNMLGDTQ